MHQRSVPRLAAGGLLLLTVRAPASPALETHATYRTLDNGLVVIVEGSHRTDVVALQVAYGVGSRDERSGERGCAHLFEHLMFEGSAHVPTNQFDAWLTAGGGENNAWTSEDGTVYHETFPSGTLDLALFLESDRMGFLEAGLDDENLSNQRQVVLQERYEGYAEPGGRDWDALTRWMWPASHPYHHPVIGTVADVRSVSVEQVRAFWRRHYRPSNAVLTMVGHVDPVSAFARVEHWFSDVRDRPAEEPREVSFEAEWPGTIRDGVLEDDVAERTVYVVWPGVAASHPDAAALKILSYLLSAGRGTRLDDALYYTRTLTTSDGAFHVSGDLGGRFVAYASDATTPLRRLRRKIEAVASSFTRTPPTEGELARARISIRSWLADSLERPARRAEMLSDCFLREGDPNCTVRAWERYAAVSPDEIVRVAQTYLVDAPSMTMSVVPRGDRGALPGAVPVALP